MKILQSFSTGKPRSGGRPNAGRPRFFTLKGRRKLALPVYLVLGLGARILWSTLRLVKHDPGGLLDHSVEMRPNIFILWHNRLILMPLIFRRRQLRRVAILASDSRDGEYAATYMRFFGCRPVRGSSSRGGARALRSLKRQLQLGYAVGLTPDGPRGPRYSVQKGVVALSQMTGLPIVPVSINTSHRWELGGWDRMQIPKPFSRVELVVGEPILVPGEADQADRQLWLERVDKALTEITVD